MSVFLVYIAVQTPKLGNFTLVKEFNKIINFVVKNLNRKAVVDIYTYAVYCLIRKNAHNA